MCKFCVRLEGIEVDNKKAVRGIPAWIGIGHREVSFVFKKARGIY